MNGLAGRTRSRTENIRLPPTLPPQTRLKVFNERWNGWNNQAQSEMVQGAGFGLNIKMGFNKFGQRIQIIFVLF